VSALSFPRRRKKLAKKNRINLSKPFEELSKKARETLVEGAGGLPGILGILDETYQASSEAYREWLTDYMSPAECPACHGKRLRPASLSVRVKNFAISLAEIAVRDAPVRDGAGDAMDELAHGSLALGGVLFAVKIFRHDDFRGEDRPRLRHFNVLLLEDDFAGIIGDFGGALVPFDLVEWLHVGVAEHARDGE